MEERSLAVLSRDKMGASERRRDRLSAGSAVHYWLAPEGAGSENLVRPPPFATRRRAGANMPQQQLVAGWRRRRAATGSRCMVCARVSDVLCIALPCFASS